MKFHQFFNLILAFWLEGCRGIRPSTRLIASTTGHRWGNQLGSCLADGIWITKLLKTKSKKRWNHKLRTIYPKIPANLQHISSSIYPNTRNPLHHFPTQVPAWVLWLLLSLHSRRNASSSAAAAPWRAAPLRRPRRPRRRRQGRRARWFQASREDLRMLRRWAHFIHPRAA